MDADPFDILGLEPVFDLDDTTIQGAYLARTAALHPDLDADADPQALARLNHAMQTLIDAERRANALLARLGGPTREQDRTLPPDFLADMMETQETIEAARNDDQDLDPWRAWADRRRQHIIEAVGERFAALHADPSPDDLRNIRIQLNVWRYIERIAEQLNS